MMLTAVINDQSLLVQGIISHFRRTAPGINIQVVDVGQNAVNEKIIALHPDVIIVESGELAGASVCPLNKLFSELPGLIVVEVNHQTSTVQVIRSQQFKTTGVADLLNILEGKSSNLAFAC